MRVLKTVTEVFATLILRAELLSLLKLKKMGKTELAVRDSIEKNLDTEQQAGGGEERGERKKENGGRGGETESL